jgi:hypothetical protein
MPSPLGKILSKYYRRCDALLAVIGPAWLDMRDEDGNRRLDDPNDFGGAPPAEAFTPVEVAMVNSEHACAAAVVVERVGR